MSADPPASPLITPDLRRRLQQRYEEAVRLLKQPPVDRARVHELLAECLRADPGNILYLDATLANLRQWSARPMPAASSWLSKWASAGWKRLRGESETGGDFTPHTSHSVLSTQYSVPSTPELSNAWQLLRRAPEVLHDEHNVGKTLHSLAEACALCDLDEAELRYRLAARDVAPDDPDTLRMLARTLTRQGQFEEAVKKWFAVLALTPDAEAEQAVEDLRGSQDCDEQATSALPNESLHDPAASIRLARMMRSHGAFAIAELYLAEAQAALGGDLSIREEREELQIARADHRVAIARRRAKSDPHPKAQGLVGSLENEHNRLEIEILHLRCERMPGDLKLRLELGRRLKQAGNYSGAIQRLEEARSDPTLAVDVLLELGECWQHLRQFEKALDFYRQAIAIADAQREPRTLVAALYRVGVLAAAMQKNSEAREALTRLVASDPGYKDAGERLDKLPPS